MKPEKASDSVCSLFRGKDAALGKGVSTLLIQD